MSKSKLFKEPFVVVCVCKFLMQGGTLWHNLNLNPKCLSSQIVYLITPYDDETRWLGMILKIYHDGSE